MSAVQKYTLIQLRNCFNKLPHLTPSQQQKYKKVLHYEFFTFFFVLSY
jgi:hypothetical protein